jgi:hypothetical protein
MRALPSGRPPPNKSSSDARPVEIKWRLDEGEGWVPVGAGLEAGIRRVNDGIVVDAEEEMC